MRTGVGDEGGGWGAQTKEVFAKNSIDVCTKASKIKGISCKGPRVGRGGGGQLGVNCG